MSRSRKSSWNDLKRRSPISTVYENIELPLIYLGTSKQERMAVAWAVIGNLRLILADHAHRIIRLFDGRIVKEAA